ncbi:MAG: FAD-binding oxidoreductase [Candidatus Duberdicusella sinuisediminis]|nr:MAG: FAD-binding oxidoreductase [Candidatus Omnitrophota bacterium]
MIVKEKKQDFLSYLEDTSNLKGKAKVLFIPEEEKEVSFILLQASQQRLPVTFSGAGTGTTGGRVPLEGAILSLERLNKIIDIDPKKKIVKAEAGVTLESLEKEVNKYALSFRALPTEPLAFLGGVISTSASGVRGFKYSSVRKYVQKIKVAFSNGEIVEIPRGKFFANKRKFDFTLGRLKFKFNLPTYASPQIKSSAGYYVRDNVDLIDLFIGQEGTLGCILEAELSLQKAVPDYFDCLVFFDREESALNFVEEVKVLKERGSFYPCALEYFDRNSLDFLSEDYPSIPSGNCGVYLEQEINSSQEKSKVLDYWCSLIEKHSSLDKCWFAEDKKSKEKLSDFRHKLPQKINEFLRRHHQEKCATDIAVPPQHFREMYNFYEEKAKVSQINYVNFGHIGENHLHFNFLPKNSEESFKAKGYIWEFIRKAISLGGTVSAEHGIGKIKKPYLEIMYGKSYLKEMALLKKVFDPSCILGLDNIFPQELLFENKNS